MWCCCDEVDGEGYRAPLLFHVGIINASLVGGVVASRGGDIDRGV